MKKSQINTYIMAMVLSLSIPMISSCSHGDKEMTTAQKVALYYLKDNAKQNSHHDEIIDAYFDFSDGMNYAYVNDTTKNILKNMVNKVSSETGNRIYSLSNAKITRLPDKATDLYNKIMEVSSYQQQYAPIEKTLDVIVKNGNNALLITDFEEYTKDGKIQQAAFASKYFTEWLKMGNYIYFYVTDYMEKDIKKHLYYTVFCKDDHIKNLVMDALKDQPKNYKTFHLSTNPCTIRTEYPGAAYGGNYLDESGEDAISATLIGGGDPAGESYTNFNLPEITSTIFSGTRYLTYIPQTLNLEYYPFEETWENIVKNTLPENREGLNPPYTDLIRHLFVNLKNQDSYKVTKMSVVATDIEKDMDLFTKSRYALLKKPKMIDDGEGGLVADLSEGANEYYDEKGNLISQYKYTPQQTPEILDLFELNQRLFENTMKKDPKRVEIGIDFKQGSSGVIPGYTSGDMLRLDIVIAQCQPNMEKLHELFSWQNNSNLEDAIRITLQQMNPIGRVVYSYFIKTAN